METRSRLDSLSGVVLTAWISTSSLSQPSIRNVPSARSGKVRVISRVTPEYSGAAKTKARKSPRADRRDAERDSIRPPSKLKTPKEPRGKQTFRAADGTQRRATQRSLKLKLTVEITSPFFPSIGPGVARHCRTAVVAASASAGSPSKTFSTDKVPSD